MRRSALRATLPALLAVCGALATCAPERGRDAPSTPPDAGGAEAPSPVEAPLVTLELLSGHTALVPGRTALIGASFRIEPGWHVYGHQPSDSGAPLHIALRLPAGYEALPARWPAPKRHLGAGGLLDHVHESELLVVIPVRVPSDAVPGREARLAVETDWMVCAETCVLGRANAELTLPLVATDAEARPSDHRPRFEAVTRRWARDVDLDAAGLEVVDDSATVSIGAPGARWMAFYPEAECVRFADLAHEGEAQGDRLLLRLHPSAATDARLIGTLEIRGRVAQPEFLWLDRPL